MVGLHHRQTEGSLPFHRSACQSRFPGTRSKPVLRAELEERKKQDLQKGTWHITECPNIGTVTSWTATKIYQSVNKAWYFSTSHVHHVKANLTYFSIITALFHGRQVTILTRREDSKSLENLYSLGIREHFLKCSKHPINQILGRLPEMFISNVALELFL